VTSLARTEREALCDLFLEVGPDADTLCEGWRTRDLAAHLVLRETRPDAAAGILFSQVAPWTQHVQDRLARTPWERLVRWVHQGRWPLLPTRWERVDTLLNTLENYVHHEDVRRAQPEWQPRVLPPVVQDTLWRALDRPGIALRRHGVTLTLRTPDGRQREGPAARYRVTVQGEPSELVLFAFGRSGVARVQLRGDDDALRALHNTPFDV